MRNRMLAAMSALVLAATLVGCGPAGNGPKDNRPANKPPAAAPPPVATPETVTFWAWTYGPNYEETINTVGFTLTSKTASGNIATITKKDGTTQLAKFVEPAVLSPYPAEVTLGPGIALVEFELTAVLPKGYTLTCEVRYGPKDTPHAALISSHSTKLSEQTNALPVATAAVTCSYPG